MTASFAPAPRPAPHSAQDNQRAASDPAASVWVNASAGAGKTTVLTDRVTRLLLAGVPPEKILCLTYTRAGAAEMTNRVTARFSLWVGCDDKTLYADLDQLQAAPPPPHQLADARRLFARVLSCPGGLRIRTIHSFCQEILSRFPIEAGLPPHFTLIDDQELDRLKDDIIDDMLTESAANPDTAVARALSVLIAEQGEHGFGKTLNGVLKECSRLHEDSAALSARTRRLLALAPGDTAEQFRRAAMMDIPVEAMRQMASWLDEGSAKRRMLTEILDLPPDRRGARFDDYRALFLTQKDQPVSERSVAPRKIREQYPEILTLAGREAARLLSALERIESASIAASTDSVVTFGAEMARRLAAAKKARAALDYDDLIFSTEKLLRQPGIGAWILYKLDNGIDHILVDEAQDTSRAQWNIVQALTAEFYAGAGARQTHRTLFVVGDEKQSIFSFQNADPEAFLGLRAFFARKLADAGSELDQIPLHTSFRSAPAILNAVDAIFAADSARQGVSPEPIAHFAARNRDGSAKSGRVEVWPLLKPVKADISRDGAWEMPIEYEEEHDPQAELAQRLAHKIKNWLTQGEVLSGMTRPVRATDIMILLRRRGRFADLMVRALKSHDVPVTGIDRMRLLRPLAVMDLLALVRFVLLPEDDLNLAALLRGPLIGLSEEQLMELAIERAGSLWQRVRDLAGFAAARDYLAARLNQADFSTPFDFLSHSLNAPCPANAVSGRKALWARLGIEALDPIEELLNAAQDFSRHHAPSLQNFLRWLTLSDAEIKRELDSGTRADDGGQVRIMTVHASKGMEAPIVFLPDTAAAPRANDIAQFQWSADSSAGGAPLFLTRKPAFGAAARVWQAARQRQMQEYRRLFYVALTRAANRLYICGWQGRNDGDDNWHSLAVAALRPRHQDDAAVEDGNADIICADAALAPFAASPAGCAPSAPPQPEPLPDWALRPAPVAALVIGTAPPSTADAAATPDAAFRRGRIIHRLLQSLPDIAQDKRAGAMRRFLVQPRHGLTDDQQAEITREITTLLNDENFAALFAPDSRAEVALAGKIDGVDMFRQVDRLCWRGDEVWIVDYKTNRPPPSRPEDIPQAYRRQLGEYRLLLQGIYPGRAIRCFLLWTYAPRLMEVVFC